MSSPQEVLRVGNPGWKTNRWVAPHTGGRRRQLRAMIGLITVLAVISIATCIATMMPHRTPMLASITWLRVQVMSGLTHMMQIRTIATTIRIK